MKILTIVGKVDTRVLAYPIARALSLNGLTAIITDDGAYRRLYHGEEMQGTVSGIDISVGLKTNEELANSLNSSGIPYDNIIVVSSGFIPADSTGIIVCHGIDRSMMGMSQAEEEALMQKEEEEKKVKTQADKKKSGNILEKKKTKTETDTVTADIAEEIIEESETKVAQAKDKIVIPDGIPFTEVQISYSSPSIKGLTSILLKDSFMNYIYSCEERKEITVYPDRTYNKTLAKIISDVAQIEQVDAIKLVERTEYIQAKKK